MKNPKSAQTVKTIITKAEEAYPKRAAARTFVNLPKFGSVAGIF